VHRQIASNLGREQCGQVGNLISELPEHKQGAPFRMDTKELLEVYKSLFETWRFQVNSHWQRSSFFAAFETVALTACWKLFALDPGKCTAPLGLILDLLGIALTLVWLLINNRTHKYALYWLEQVGELEIKIMREGGERGIDSAKKIVDPKRTTVTPDLMSHHRLEQAVPLLFIVAWAALLLSQKTCWLVIGQVTMQNVISYESVSLAVAAASLLASVAAAFTAKSALSQARRVADRDQKDWKQRKWYDLYFKADEAYDALDRFQSSYPSTSSPSWNTEEMLKESHDLMHTMRTVHRIALVFPQNQEVKALFDATTAFKNMEEATSKDRLSKVLDAVEGIRQRSLIDVSVLD
jgi:hypothetical protein